MNINMIVIRLLALLAYEYQYYSYISCWDFKRSHSQTGTKPGMLVSLLLTGSWGSEREGMYDLVLHYKGEPPTSFPASAFSLGMLQKTNYAPLYVTITQWHDINHGNQSNQVIICQSDNKQKLVKLWIWWGKLSCVACIVNIHNTDTDLAENDVLIIKVNVNSFPVNIILILI